MHRKSRLAHFAYNLCLTLALFGLFGVATVKLARAEETASTAPVTAEETIAPKVETPETSVPAITPEETVPTADSMATSTPPVEAPAPVSDPAPAPMLAPAVTADPASSLLAISDEFGGSSGSAPVTAGAVLGVLSSSATSPAPTLVIGTLTISDEVGGATVTPAAGEGAFSTSLGEGSFVTPAVGEGTFTTIGGGGGCTTNCGGGGGGGGCIGGCGGGGGGGPVPPPNRFPPAPCPLYLREFIRLGANNNPVEVRKLQAFLNVFRGEHLPITGIYSQADFEAVTRLQSQYLNDVLQPWGIEESTGYVFITTRLAINNIYCGRSTANDLDLRNYYPTVLETVATNPADTATLASATSATTTSAALTPRPNFFQAAALGFLKLFNLNNGSLLIVLLLLAILFMLFLIWRLAHYPDTKEPALGEREGVFYDVGELTSSDDEVLVDDSDTLLADLSDQDETQPPLDNLK